MTEVESGMGAKALAGAQGTGQESDDADNRTLQIDAGRGSGRERALHCDGTAGHTMPGPGDVDVPRPVSPYSGKRPLSLSEPRDHELAQSLLEDQLLRAQAGQAAARDFPEAGPLAVFSGEPCRTGSAANRTESAAASSAHSPALSAGPGSGVYEITFDDDLLERQSSERGASPRDRWHTPILDLMRCARMPRFYAGLTPTCRTTFALFAWGVLLAPSFPPRFPRHLFLVVKGNTETPVFLSLKKVRGEQKQKEKSRGIWFLISDNS